MGGSGISDDRKCVQIARIGASAHFDTAPDIHDAFSHFDPGRFLLAMAGHSTANFITPRIINGGLDSQYGTSFVVHLDRVLFDPMLDADAFHAAAHMASDFAVEETYDATAQKPQYILAMKMMNGVVQESRINVFQKGWIPKQDVGGIFALTQTPIMGLKVQIRFATQKWMNLGGEFFQPPRPGLL